MKNTTVNSPRSRGRPRAFDRSAALAIAGETFWQLGYEGASIAELTAAMGITPQSLYAAFTSKADLYREALDWYQSEVGAFAAAALEKEDVVAAFKQLLMEAAKQFCRPDRPRGCMISMAVLTCARDNDAIADMVAREREATMKALHDRIEQGISQGQLSTDTNAMALARFIGAIIQGMSVQARDGASAKDLEAVAQLAIEQITRFRAQSATD
ncbi:TetR/AcrR family transcriptional regulator [Halomonas sp. SpR8]|uniref:TetR/AcrR family transcriptional regulator n=1 Tax=Halomonas sp. SpR8 TaxID=3050463 RepID=UPI0027E3D5D8|nr:TetR/AcrR family transcriptional regulator [Halomonas sp. SpR8]MDQ7728501.1 TetR/AcrR family transcriptional regulator [Halomonas sp. SpR8]